jgi:hypothetical protein
VNTIMNFGFRNALKRTLYRGLGIFLFTTASRTALGPTQPRIQWVPGALSLGVKRPGREADHSPPSSAEVKNAWNYTSTPPVRLHDVVVKHRDSFTLTLQQRYKPAMGGFDVK